MNYVRLSFVIQNAEFRIRNSRKLEWGVAPLLDRVRTMAQMEQLDENKEALRLLEEYLVFHSGRLNYRERLAAGLSIGSGQVERACKNLIGARLRGCLKITSLKNQAFADLSR